MNESALIVSATAPVPVDNGKRVVLNGILTYLVNRLGAENVHYAVLGRPDEEHPYFPGVLHPIVKPRTSEQIRALHRWLGDPSYTMQEAMLGPPSLGAQISDLISDIRPSIEVYDTLRFVQHAPRREWPTRRVLYMDDLFSVRYQRMLDVAAQDAVDMDPLGGFVENVPATLRGLARRPWFYLPLLRSERDRIRRREAEVVHDQDISLLISSTEVDALRRRAGSDRIRTLTPLIPPPAPVRRTRSEPPEFVYLGKLNIPHNDDAICSFLRDSMPLLARSCPDVRLRIIGKSPSQALQNLVASRPGTRLEGFVDDLDSAMARATAVLAPLRFGSGVKIKVLEALGRGVPVVATSTAAEGIPVDPDGSDGCIVEDDLSKWPAILAELGTGARDETLSAAASSFFARTYGPATVYAQYDEIFDLVTSTRPV